MNRHPLVRKQNAREKTNFIFLIFLNRLSIQSQNKKITKRKEKVKTNPETSCQFSAQIKDCEFFFHSSLGRSNCSTGLCDVTFLKTVPYFRQNWAEFFNKQSFTPSYLGNYFQVSSLTSSYIHVYRPCMNRQSLALYLKLKLKLDFNLYPMYGWFLVVFNPILLVWFQIYKLLFLFIWTLCRENSS